MPKSIVTIVCVVSVIFVSGCRELSEGPEEGTDRESPYPTSNDPTSPETSAEWCPSNTFVGDIEGMSGQARLAYEVGLSVIYVGGEITSETAHYYFSGCELYRDTYTGMPTNNVCYVDVTGMYTGERFRAELQFYEIGSERGFYFTANAFEGMYSTSYNFICQ